MPTNISALIIVALIRGAIAQGYIPFIVCPPEDIEIPTDTAGAIVLAGKKLVVPAASILVYRNKDRLLYVVKQPPRIIWKGIKFICNIKDEKGLVQYVMDDGTRTIVDLGYIGPLVSFVISRPALSAGIVAAGSTALIVGGNKLISYIGDLNNMEKAKDMANAIIESGSRQILEDSRIPDKTLLTREKLGEFDKMVKSAMDREEIRRKLSDMIFEELQNNNKGK